jgi:hypothetical protein
MYSRTIAIVGAALIAISGAWYIHKQEKENCWAHALAAFIEISMHRDTHNGLVLDVGRIEARAREVCSEHLVATDGCMQSMFECYLNNTGPLYFKGVNITTPINVTAARRVCEYESAIERLSCAKRELERGPLIATMCNRMLDSLATFVLADVHSGCVANHAVVITQIKNDDDDDNILIVFQDSQGPNFGNNGYAAVMVSAVDLVEQHIGRNILDYLVTANVGWITPQQ